MRRVLIYAAIYGCIGAMVGMCVALYTQDSPLPKNIVLGNGSTTKANSERSAMRTPTAAAEVVESPATETVARED